MTRDNHAKVILDEVFGAERFINEIVWKRQSAHSDAKRYGPIHDTIFFYGKTSDFTWNPLYEPLGEGYVETFFTNVDEDGRRFTRGDLTAPGPRPNLEYEWRGYYPPRGRCWAVPKEKLDAYYDQGRIFFPKVGIPRLKRYPEDSPGVLIQDIWTDIRIIHNQSSERVGYPTQKPETLLERIIKASSNEGDLVADLFCGSGTTMVVAEKLGRRWVGCDLSRFAVQTSRKRLLDIPDVRPFVVQNLGKYERQLWHAAEFGEGAEAKQAAYRKLIMDLYHATPVNGYAWLHGVKGGRMVHVGAVDSPVSVGDVTSIAGEFRRAVGTGEGAPQTNGVDLLGWDFAFEMNEVAKQKAAEAGISMRFLKIPHDVMDKRARDQGDIRFFELAALSVDSAVKGKSLTLTLTDFVIPPDEVPEDVQRAITKWEQWIDYWAVDWDNKSDTFHNQWQDYRTRKKRELQKTVSHEYEEPGEYVVVVKVIDILGNDTTKTLTVKVG